MWVRVLHARVRALPRVQVNVRACAARACVRAAWRMSPCSCVTLFPLSIKVASRTSCCGALIVQHVRGLKLILAAPILVWGSNFPRRGIDKLHRQSLFHWPLFS